MPVQVYLGFLPSFFQPGRFCCPCSGVYSEPALPPLTQILRLCRRRSVLPGLVMARRAFLHEARTVEPFDRAVHAGHQLPFSCFLSCRPDENYETGRLDVRHVAVVGVGPAAASNLPAPSKTIALWGLKLVGVFNQRRGARASRRRGQSTNSSSSPNATVSTNLPILFSCAKNWGDGQSCFEFLSSFDLTHGIARIRRFPAAVLQHDADQ